MKFWLGIYLTWETILVNPNLDQRLIELQQSNVNFVWTTNGPDTKDDIKNLIVKAKAKNIDCVIGSGQWYILGPNDNVDAKFNKIQTLWSGLQPSERPVAFSIADEPTPEFMNLVENLASKCKSANIPVTCVTPPEYFSSMSSTVLDANFLAMDHYPFFAKGLDSNPPVGKNALITYQNSILLASGNLVLSQGFQTWLGPARQESDGTVTLLPGASPFWISPTNKQIMWQAWTSVMNGSAGHLFFAYGGAGDFIPDPNKPQSTTSNTVDSETSTGGTATLVSFPDYKQAQQMTGLKKVYQDLSLLPLSGLKFTASCPIISQLVGDNAAFYIGADGKKYLLITSAPDESDRFLRMKINANNIKPLGNSPSGVFLVKNFVVKIPAGSGGMYLVQ